MSGSSPPSTADGNENAVGSPRTMATKQIEMESELQQLRSMLCSLTGAGGPDLGAEPQFVLSDEHRFALQHRRYDDDSSESDDDDYTQFAHRRRQMERVLVRELKTLKREKDMIQNIRSLRRDRDNLLEKERSWARERLALEKEKEKLEQTAADPTGFAPNLTDAAQTSSALDPAVASATPADEPTKTPDRAQHAIPKLNYVEWSTFKALRENSERESFAIDVLKGEPVVTFDSTVFWRPKKTKQSRSKGYEAKATMGSAKPDAKQKQPLVPERIRIHSKSILKILGDVSGETLSDTAGPVAMTRPFKFLIYHEEQIRQKFNELKATFGDGDNTAATENAAHADPQAQESNTDDKDKYELTTSAVAYEQLRCLIEFLDTEIRPKILSLSGDTSASQAQNVSFADVWYLFKPGDEVVDQGCRQAYRVVGMTSIGHKAISPWHNYYDKSKAKSEETPVTLHCVYVDFDGKSLGPMSKLFLIPRFDGERAITSLEVYPIRYAKVAAAAAPSAYRQMLIARGRMFLDVAGVKHMHYNGLTLDGRDEVDGQVVVDFEEAFVARGNSEWRPQVEQLIGSSGLPKVDDDECTAECCRTESILKDGDVETKRSQDYIGNLIPDERNRVPSVAIYPRLLRDARSQGNELTEDELIIMNYRVFGFVLRSRKWAALDLTYLSSINLIGRPESSVASAVESEAEAGLGKRETAFDQLVLPPGHKKMVLSLIAQHYRDKESGTADTEQVDIVRGKGKGLIILLHGAPGVGKTTTAEGVAELFQKPLFQITCGDLGTTASDVEVALETNFALASRWGCILLLDEADVFLTARSPQDFKRNGLVAVFLRVLEYYAGILFLTTNRIGDFDEAFASRVHISLHYPQLDQESTLEIFKLNLRLIRQRFEKKGRRLTIDEHDILSFARAYWDDNKKMRWNGRQIRNGCQTALALAEFDAQGGSHERIIDADAEIKLKVGHLDTVSRAYLDFISYLTKIYGADAERRAKFIGIRARETDAKVDPKEGGEGPVKRGALHTPSSSSLDAAASAQPGPSAEASPAYALGIPAAAAAVPQAGNYPAGAAPGPYQYFYPQPGAPAGYPSPNAVGQAANVGMLQGQQPLWQGPNVAGPIPGAWNGYPQGYGQGYGQGPGQG